MQLGTVSIANAGVLTDLKEDSVGMQPDSLLHLINESNPIARKRSNCMMTIELVLEGRQDLQRHVLVVKHLEHVLILTNIAPEVAEVGGVVGKHKRYRVVIVTIHKHIQLGVHKVLKEVQRVGVVLVTHQRHLQHLVCMTDVHGNIVIRLAVDAVLGLIAMDPVQRLSIESCQERYRLHSPVDVSVLRRDLVSIVEVLEHRRNRVVIAKVDEVGKVNQPVGGVGVELVLTEEGQADTVVLVVVEVLLRKLFLRERAVGQWLKVAVEGVHMAPLLVNPFLLSAQIAQDSVLCKSKIQESGKVVKCVSNATSIGNIANQDELLVLTGGGVLMPPNHGLEIVSSWYHRRVLRFGGVVVQPVVGGVRKLAIVVLVVGSGFLLLVELEDVRAIGQNASILHAK